MNLFIVGLNHRTAPIEARELLAFRAGEAAEALKRFGERFRGSEAVILSTCNRVEIVVASARSLEPDDITAFLLDVHKLPLSRFRHQLYQLRDTQACAHLLRVISGLDSMVLGEAQIVRQAKEALALATQQGTAGTILTRFFEHALQVSKRVRSETSITVGKTSVASVAVDLVRQNYDDVAKRQVLLIGGGKMVHLLCGYLRSAQVRRFTIITRTATGAMELARSLQAETATPDQLDAKLLDADIVITASSCPRQILTPQRVARAQRRRGGRRLFLIDLAVPRNVDPTVADGERVCLYDIDNLGQIAARNEEQRRVHLDACEQIIEEEVRSFERWLYGTQLNPLVAEMYRDARHVSESELQRLYRQQPGLSADQRQAIDRFAARLVGKFMHRRIQALRQGEAGLQRSDRCSCGEETSEDPVDAAARVREAVN